MTINGKKLGFNLSHWCFFSKKSEKMIEATKNEEIHNSDGK